MSTEVKWHSRMRSDGAATKGSEQVFYITTATFCASEKQSRNIYRRVGDAAERQRRTLWSTPRDTQTTSGPTPIRADRHSPVLPCPKHPSQLTSAASKNTWSQGGAVCSELSESRPRRRPAEEPDARSKAACVASPQRRIKRAVKK